jgi:hypothetical protein
MVLGHYISIRVIGGDLQKFVRVYMLTAFSRLILYMVIILIYVFKNPDNTINFVITFFVFYVVFTTFEVREISRTMIKKPE